MKLGYNRKIESIELGGTVFEIKIVPIRAFALIAMHDNEGDHAKQSEMIYDVIESILIANGYEFDKAFWEKYADYTMLVEFVTVCTAKDIIEGKKKALEGS